MKGKRVAATLALAVVITACCAIAAEPATAQGSPAGQTESANSTFTAIFQEWVAIIGGVAAVAVVIAGGVLAWRNAQIFRAKAPHVIVEHEVSHRTVGTKYVHIFVTAVLHNKSRVHVEFLDGFANIRQVKPISNADVEVLYEQVFVDQEFANVQWPLLSTLRHRWEQDGLLVEPGETETENFDFIVQRGVESVAVTTYFYNSRVVGKIPDDTELDTVKRRKRRFRRWLNERGPVGWGRASVYDIVQME